MLTSTLLVSTEFFKPFNSYYFFNALLLVLQALHIFWAYLILCMVYKFVFLGKVRSGPVNRKWTHVCCGGERTLLYWLFFFLRWSEMNGVMRRVRKKRRRRSPRMTGTGAAGSTEMVPSTPSWSRSRKTVF